MKPTPIKVVSIKRGPVMWPSNREEESFYEMTYCLRLRVGASLFILEGIAVGGWEAGANCSWNGNVYRDKEGEEDPPTPRVLRIIDSEGSFDESFSTTEHAEFVCLAPIAIGEPHSDWDHLDWVRHDMVPEWSEAAEEVIKLDEEIVLAAISPNKTADFRALAAKREELVAACTKVRTDVEDRIDDAIWQKLPAIPEPDPIHWWKKLEECGSQPIADVDLLAGEYHDVCLIAWKVKQPADNKPIPRNERWAADYLSYRVAARPDPTSVREALKEATGSEPTEQHLELVWEIVKDSYEQWQEWTKEDELE